MAAYSSHGPKFWAGPQGQTIPQHQTQPQATVPISHGFEPLSVGPTATGDQEQGSGVQILQLGGFVGSGVAQDTPTPQAAYT